MRVLEGIKVIEMGMFGFVPAAASALGDWGADVIKLEHPVTGDPVRGITAWDIPPGTNGVTFLWETFNRGKRSVGLDLSSADGRIVFERLVEDADVFLTNFLPPARSRLGIDVDDVRRINPRIIYGRGSAHGPAGAESDSGGFDGITYWHRTGIGMGVRPRPDAYPLDLAGPGFGDVQSGMNLAGGIAAALFHRERTGQGTVVDVSLLASGLWAMQASVAGTSVTKQEVLTRFERAEAPNPLVNLYETEDGRYIALAMLQSDRYWGPFCEAIGEPDLVKDPRFVDHATRKQHCHECIAKLDAVFSTRPYAQWIKLLAMQEGQWAPVEVPGRAGADPQARANGYVTDVDCGGDDLVTMVASPVQFGEQQIELTRAPAHGEHTEEVLLDHGFGWDQLVELKQSGAIT